MRISLIGSKGSGKTEFLRLLSKVTGSEYAEGERRILTFNLRDPDAQLLAQAYQSAKLSLPSISLIDIDNIGPNVLALKSSELPHVRESDALILVVRGTSLDELQEAVLSALKEIISLDISSLEASLEGKWVKREPERAKLVREYLHRLRDISTTMSDTGKHQLTEEHYKALSPYSLLSLKGIGVLVNVSYDELAPRASLRLRDLRDKLTHFLSSIPLLSDRPLVLDIRMERELLELGDEADEFMREYGIDKLHVSPPERFTGELLRSLNLIRFFTANQRETREYLAREGIKAVEAAGKIHTDMMRGFIRAEVFNVSHLKHMSLKEVERMRKKKVDRNYILDDGDVLYVLFSK